MDDNISNGTVFYAACLPLKIRQSKEDFDPKRFVSSDKNEIIKLIKQYQGSRFKSFDLYENALKFVEEKLGDNFESNQSDNLSSPNSNQSPSSSVPTEESILFPSLDIRDLNVFKQSIVNKQLDTFKRNVFTNPRYLISNYFDSPTIIMQGPRYNAVHLAIRFKAPEILDFILDTINTVSFVQKMNPNLDSESLIDKRDHILDLYLNSPDKVNFDTPLHMACKICNLDCISILADYIPVLDTEKLNKQNLLPHELVQDLQARKKILDIIHSSVFITVQKCPENLNKSINKEYHMGRKILQSKLDHKKEKRISAIVGPMTTEKSKTVYDVMKSPKKCNEKQRQIRLKDPDRGIERVICELSIEFEVPYCEYWPFLNDYANFSTEEGLKRLNDYFRSKQDELDLSSIIGRLNLDEEDDLKQTNGREEIHCDKNKIEKKEKETEEEEEEEESELYYTAPTSPRSVANENGEIDSDRLRSDQLYINGLERTQIDFDVYEMIQSAQKRGKISITGDEFRTNHPFVDRWLEAMKLNDCFIANSH